MPPKLESCVDRLYNDAAFKAKYPDEKERKSHAYAICTAAQKGGAMTERLGYITLAESSIEFKEGEVSWVHAFVPGKWNHPRFGDIEITPERIARFADNINNKVRGIDASIDYSHKDEEKAAGWVQKAEVRPDGLWLSVEWTPDGAKAVKDKEFRYFSPAYLDEWEDSEGTKHQDVLIGGGLTNSPFLKELEPINMSDFILRDEIEKPKPEPKTYLEEMVELGYYEDGIELRDIPQNEREGHPAADFAGKGQSFPIFQCDDVAAAARSMGRAGPSNYGTDVLKANIIRIAKRKGFTKCLPQAWREQTMSEGGEMDELVKRLQETLGLVDADEDVLVSRVVELRDYHGAKASAEEKAKKFAEDYPEEARRLTDLESKRKGNETKVKLSEWASQGLPAVVHEKVKNFRSTLSDDGATKFDELLDHIVRAGMVKLTENGSSRSATVELSEEIEREIAKKMSDDNISYKDALKLVSKEHPEWARGEYLKPVGGGE